MRPAISDWMTVMDARGRLMAVVGLLLGFIVSVLEILGAGIVAVTIQLATGGDAEPVELPVLGRLDDLLPASTPAGDLRWMAAIGGGFFVLRGAAVLLQQYVTFRSAFSLAVRLTDQTIERLLQQSYEWHLSRNSAELSGLAIGVAQNFASKVFTPLQMAATQALIVASLLVVALAVEPVGALAAAASLGLVVVASVRGTKRRLATLSEVEVEQQLLSQRLSIETFQAVREVKLLDLQDAVRQRVRTSRRTWAAALRRSATIVAAPRTLIETVAFCALVGIVAFRAQGDSDSALAGVGVLGYAVIRILPTANNLITHLNTVRSAGAGTRRLAEILRLDADDGGSTGRAQRAELPLRASGVSYAYPSGETVLEAVDVDLRRGESLGLVGMTGCGKSTLLDVLIGLLEPTAGSVQLDGVPLAACRASWWRQIGIVPQHITLLDATLAENIALGLDHSEVDRDALARAVELARLSEVVDELPAGLDTPIGERGTRLSGGQRQRVAIARALYRDPSIIFMDEGTSALDAATERSVIAGLRHGRHDRTLVMVAHRLSTLQACDEIIVLHEGTVEARGTYDDLLASNVRFRGLAADPYGRA